MSEHETQNNRILSWLRDGKSITPKIALRRIGTFRLAARIYELKKMGHKIVMTREHDGRIQWARYTLLRFAK